ncbi:MAG: hypothetical protein KDK55_02900 [Chlamydiia bacterium]|nr:hypothetical protein [Chlamydiia bacterium]
MQRIALDTEKKRIITVNEAISSQNYLCLECQKIVRKRGGHHRKAHFFHLKHEAKCSQHQKSLIHLHLQHYLVSNFPNNEGSMEVHFPIIGRIADVVWKKHKLIFEIQVSPISCKEILSRNVDYKSLGFSVIWILHDKTFNTTRLSQSEMLLTSYPHYYTNFSSEGKGIVYDQFSVDRNAYRLAKTPARQVLLNIPDFSPPFPSKEQFSRHLYPFVLKRWKLWQLSFEGDLLSCPPPLEHMKAFEELYFPQTSRCKRIIHQFLLAPYLNYFHLMCEKMFY